MNNTITKVTKEFSILAHNIKFLRKSRGISQEELANQLEIKRSNIAAYESKNVEPRLSVILRMARLFDIRLQTLIDTKLTDTDYLSNNKEDTLLMDSDNQSLELKDKIEVQEFIDKSIRIRKVLEGFKAFYGFKKESISESFPNKEKLLFDIDNFLQLMEHLLTYNETVIKAIGNVQKGQ